PSPFVKDLPRFTRSGFRTILHFVFLGEPFLRPWLALHGLEFRECESRQFLRVERLLFKHLLEDFHRCGTSDQIAAGRRVLRAGAQKKAEVVSLLQPGSMPRISLANLLDWRAISCLNHEVLHLSTSIA